MDGDPHDESIGKIANNPLVESIDLGEQINASLHGTTGSVFFGLSENRSTRAPRRPGGVPPFRRDAQHSS